MLKTLRVQGENTELSPSLDFPIAYLGVGLGFSHSHDRTTFGNLEHSGRQKDPTITHSHSKWTLKNTFPQCSQLSSRKTIRGCTNDVSSDYRFESSVLTSADNPGYLNSLSDGV